MVLAGILAAQPLTKKLLSEHTIMIAGNGAAGTALAELLAEAIARQIMRCIPLPLRSPLEYSLDRGVPWKALYEGTSV